MNHLNTNERGSLLIPLIVMVPMMLFIVATYMQLNASSFRVARQDQQNTHAQLAADAGVDFAMQELVTDTTWAGTSGEIQLHNDGSTKTTYEVTVSDIDAETKNLTVVGRSFRPVTSTTPGSTVNLTVGLRPVRSGEYSIVTGVGGMIMKNSAKILNGNVFINGTLNMSNTSQIGLSILPVDVKVAHQSCPSPANATYPRACNTNENGEPITLNHSARIYGDVEATNQTNGTRMSNGGLVANSTVAPIDLPDNHDRPAQKTAVQHDLPATDGSCSLGLKTWQANTKFTGNVTVSNLCVVTVEGDVWITGNFNMANLAVLKVAEGLTTPPVIMIDGSSGATFRNSSSLLPNLIGLKGFRVITYYSTAACSPDCTDVTGADLYNSQQVKTISIENSASGAQTEFYSRWTKLEAGNTGSIGAVIGQTVELNNSLAVTFGTSVTGFGDTIWVIDSYRRTF